MTEMIANKLLNSEQFRRRITADYVETLAPEPKIVKWVKKQAKRVESSEVGQYLGNIFDGMK